MKLYWAKVKDGARIPSKRREDAGYDLYPCFEEDWLEIGPMETRMVPMGIASAFDPGYVMILKERGSTGTKGIAQRSGVIDSGYRGEYLCPVTNLNEKPLRIIKEQAKKALDPKEAESFLLYPYEKALCQAILLPVPEPEVQELRFEDLQEDLVCRPVIRWRGKPSLSVDLFKSSVEQGLFHAKEEPEPEPVFDVITLLAVERVSDAPPFVIRVDQLCLHVEHVLQGMADGPGYEVGLAGAVAAFSDNRFFDDRLVLLHDMLDQPVLHGICQMMDGPRGIIRQFQLFF